MRRLPLHVAQGVGKRSDGADAGLRTWKGDLGARAKLFAVRQALRREPEDRSSQVAEENDRTGLGEDRLGLWRSG